MKDRISGEDLSRPHRVEWTSASDAVEWEDRRFASGKEAKDFADEKSASRYAVFSGEIGIYATDRGNTIRDWI